MKTLLHAILITATITIHAASVCANIPVAAPRPQGEFGCTSKVAPIVHTTSPYTEFSTLGPPAEQRDPTLATYAYDADCTRPTPVRPSQQTHLVLGDDETLVSFTLDDRNKKLWPAIPSATECDLLIIPAAAGQHAAATIITLKRRYELQLYSGNDGPVYQRVSWQYANTSDDDAGVSSTVFDFEIPATPGVPGRPEAGGSETRSPRVGATRMSTNYRIEGNAEFKPVMVFGDGRMTYYQLSHDTKLSAVFILNKDGQGEMARVIPLGDDMYQIQEVIMYGALLKRDKDEARVFNDRGSGRGSSSCGTRPVKNINGGT